MSRFRLPIVIAAGVLSAGLGVNPSFAEPPAHRGAGDGAQRVERAHREGRAERIERDAAPREVIRERRRDSDGGAVVVDRHRGDRHWRSPRYRDRIRLGHRYYWGPGISFYLSDGYYYGDCRWLRRRALETGSRIWWRRYHRCRSY